MRLAAKKRARTKKGEMTDSSFKGYNLLFLKRYSKFEEENT
jgi:hypothetical protein